jgi:hypothetical protein
MALAAILCLASGRLAAQAEALPADSTDSVTVAPDSASLALPGEKRVQRSEPRRAAQPQRMERSGVRKNRRHGGELGGNRTGGGELNHRRPTGGGERPRHGGGVEPPRHPTGDGSESPKPNP